MGGNKGQVSVFLCIIFMAVFIVVGVLVDASRIISGKSQVERSVANAARSLLADYSTSIKEYYGIFAIDNNREKDLTNVARDYLEKNLAIGIEELQNINFYNFKVENISVTPLFSLTGDQTVKNQILEYMKYSAPKQVIENLWHKILMVKEAGKVADTYNRKLNVEKLSAQIGELQQKLKEKISGTIGNGIFQEFFINKFNKDGIRSSAIESYAEITIRQSTLYRELNAAYELMRQIEGKLHENDSNEEAGGLKEKLDMLLGRIKMMEDELDILKNERDSMEKRLKGELTGRYLEINKEARQIIEDIREVKEKIEAAIADFENYMDNSPADAHSPYHSVLESIKEDVDYIKDNVLNGETTEELIKIIENNITYLENAMERLNRASSLNWQEIDQDSGKEWIISLLKEGFGDYINIIEYDYKKAGEPVTAPDPREGMKKETEEILKKDREDEDIKNVRMEEAGINISELPSKNKYYDEDLPAFEGGLEDLPGEIDINQNDSRFVHNVFNYMGNIGNICGDFEEFRDDLYINEYIMKVFNNQVSVQGKNKAEGSSSVNKNRDSFFNSEVEYILHGDSSEKINKMKTKAQILLIRFSMNTLHAYSDSNKRELAKGIAAAVSGWWTAGAGIPIISNMVLCGWGLGEAIIDLEDLLEGKAVPFYKLKGDWKLDLGPNIRQNPSSKGNNPSHESERDISSPKSNPGLMFDYNDYLRIFLMLVNTEKKIGRIEDLIELNGRKANSAFRATNCSTWIKVEAEVSLNYLFLTSAFMPGSKKTGEGRHIFRVVWYEGY
ncbi:MAG TPA: hypothetical protein GXX20_09670 [Clostridiaceae bacterium]|nr:hypothetical protein [Clostridiaceae bacterium]